MSQKVSIGNLSDAVMKQLNEYANMATDDMKSAVRNAAKTTQKTIKSTAPSNTGKYAKSWAVKTMKETSYSLELTVHSKTRYQLAHLLEYGHAKRGGGRVEGNSHIAPAEKLGIKQLEESIERSLKHG